MSNMKNVLMAAVDIALKHDLDPNDQLLITALADAYLQGGIAAHTEIRQILRKDSA